MFPQDQHNPFLSAHAAAARDITQWPEVPVLKLIISSRIRGQAQSAVSLYPHPGAGSWDDGGDAMNARYANSQHSHSTICCAGTHTAAIPHHTILQGELQSRAANGTSQSFTRQWPSPSPSLWQLNCRVTTHTNTVLRFTYLQHTIKQFQNSPECCKMRSVNSVKSCQCCKLRR